MCIRDRVIDCLAYTFCRHGLPNNIKSDNGPQFKSHEFREYCEQHGIIHQKVTATWAQANGEVKRQNQSLLKRSQIAQAENKPWRAELRKYLTAYRSIPHNTTGTSPAELLFNWKVLGKIPDWSIDHAYDHEVHDRDAEQKAKSKAYEDIHHRASPSSIELGDKVLVQQDTQRDSVLHSTQTPLVQQGTSTPERQVMWSNTLKRKIPHPNKGQTLSQHPPHPSRN